MAGISDKAIKTPYTANKYRYNGKELQNQEFSDGSGLEEYDYGARAQDPQLGRWIVPDPLSNKTPNSSSYSYVENNPIRYLDPDGRSTEDMPSAMTSVDIDPTGKILRINEDGDPGVYMIAAAGGPESLIGFMDPNVKYRIGGQYKYYGKNDYYKKYPVAYWLGILIPNQYDPNPDQNNDAVIMRETAFQTIMLTFTEGLGELFESGSAASKGIAVIGPRATYREFAMQIGARFLNVTDEAWTWEKNVAFLSETVKRGDEVLFAENSTRNYLIPSPFLPERLIISLNTDTNGFLTFQKW
jgi:RHS repeat-associated protein